MDRTRPDPAEQVRVAIDPTMRSNEGLWKGYNLHAAEPIASSTFRRVKARGFKALGLNSRVAAYEKGHNVNPDRRETHRLSRLTSTATPHSRPLLTCWGGPRF